MAVKIPLNKYIIYHSYEHWMHLYLIPFVRSHCSPSYPVIHAQLLIPLHVPPFIQVTLQVEILLGKFVSVRVLA